MLANDYVIGGEQSGHIIFLDYNSTGDGLLTAVQLTSALRDSGMTMSQFGEFIKIYPQVLVNAKIQNCYKNTYILDYRQYFRKNAS
jgi:phosphoglucosamine mutase